MKNAERIFRTLHLATTLDGSLRASAGVADTLAALEKTASALTAADGEGLAKKEAARVVSARVRDATAKAFDECRRARGALVVADPSFEGPFAPEMLGRSARAVLAKSFFLLQHGTQRGVAMGSLAAVRAELAAAEGALAAARREQMAAREARVAAEGAWDAAYASAHGAVESVLGARGTRGRKLQEAVHVYFPKRVAHVPQDGPPGATKPVAEAKPAA